MLAKSTILATALAAGLGLLGWSAAAWTLDDPAPQAPDAPAPAVATGNPSPGQLLKDNRLKQIGLALHNYAAYASNDRAFPPQTVRGAAMSTGPAILSWRVAILPYIDEEALYKEFHLDESWDGPHNRQLISRMPEIFQTPDAPALPGHTRFQAFWGPGAIFKSQVKGEPGEPKSEGTRLSEITDGMSNTAMVGVAARPVVWTQPDDLAFIPGQEPPSLDTSDARGYAILLADGSINFLPERPTRPNFLTALLTRAGGEVLNWSDQSSLEVPPVRTLGDMSSSPPTPATILIAPASVEDRLRRLEEKMDRLLQKLDADGDPKP